MKKKVLVCLLVLSLLVTSMSNPMPLLAESNLATQGIAVLTQSFEDGLTGGWRMLPWGGSGTVTVTDNQASEGSKALHIKERAARNSIPNIDLTSLGKGKVFDISFKVKLGEGTDSYHISAKIDSATVANQYPWLTGNIAVNATEWTLFEAKGVVVPEDTNEFLIWLEGNDAMAGTADIYIDEVIIVDVTPAAPVIITETTVLEQSFEDGQVGGWRTLPWGGSATVTVTDGQASEGSKALHIKERAARNSVPNIDLTSLGKGKVFDISFKVKIGEGTDSYHISAKIDSATVANQYPWLTGNIAVNATDWTLFEAKGVVVPEDTNEFLIWLEGNDAMAGTADIYIDEVLIVDVTPTDAVVDDGRPEPLPFTMITFEDGELNGFEPRGGVEVLTVVDGENQTAGGSKALKIEGRAQAWHAPSLRVETFIKKGLEYKVTAWVKLLSPGSSQLQLSTQVGNGDGASYNNIQGQTITTEQGWVKFEGNYRYSSVGDEYVTIYIESSNNATASYLIDDISFVSTGSGTVAVDKTLTPIKDVYKDHFLIGTAVATKEFEGQRFELLKHHFNVVTAENAMKPVYAYGTYPEFDFTAEDALVTLVENAGLDLVGHTLAWHQQSEESLHTGADGQPLSEEVALANLERHITTVAKHFGDKVIAWDVLNEAVNDNPSNPSNWRGALRNSGWLRAIGDEYVEKAFLFARKALDEVGATNVKLYYNDYNDDNQSKAEAIYQMVKEINENYAATHGGKKLIDGIGMQAHYNLNTNPENVEASLLKFMSVTNEVSITELDITAGSNNVLTEEQAKQQAYLYATLMKLYRENSEHVARVTFWGLDDATSWRAAQNPLLFDGNLQAKLAYQAVIDPDAYLATYVPEEKVYKNGIATYGTPVIDGTIDAIWSQAAELEVNQYQMAWQGASGTAKALWDEEYLYVLVRVSDAQLDKSSVNPWEQDSVEVFLDQNNEKTSSYQDDDGQYRVNFDNEASFNPSSISEGFESATKVEGTNYLVEMKIPLNAITPANDTLIGFDVQINDGKDGARQSAATWNDLKGTGYMDTSVFGILKLSGKGVTPVPEPNPNPNPNPNPPSSGTNDSTNNNNSNIPSATPNQEDIEVIEIEDNELALSSTENKVVIQVEATDKPILQVSLPLADLREKKVETIEIVTEDVTASFAMSDLGDEAKSMSLSIEKVDKSTLSDDVLAIIGNQPLYNFTLTVDGESISKFKVPVTISIVFSLETGMDPNAIIVYYLNDEGELEIIKNGRYDALTGRVSFTTTHFSMYFATENVVTLADVPDNHWSRESVVYTVARKMLTLTSDNAFELDTKITREDLIKTLVDAYDLEAADATEALEVAKALGIIKGYADGSFKGEQSVTRQEFALIMYRILMLQGIEANESIADMAFEDEAHIADFAKEEIAKLRALGYIQGYGNNTFKPLNHLTKAELAAFLVR